MTESQDPVARDLDRLPGRLVADMLQVAPQHASRLVDDMLRQIGEALASDRVSFERGAGDGELTRAARVWIRPGATVGRTPSLTTTVVAGDGVVCALSIAVAEAGPGSAPTEPQVRMLAGLVALADCHADAMRPRPKPAEVAFIVDVDHDDDEADFEEIIGDSPLLRVALRRVLEVAPTDASVVLIGETGTGKELFARAVHNRSHRHGRPFVRVNCAALPPTLIESELFGHERGAFTGAVSMRRGRFELAHGGTLFLDEIGDLPADVQAKLLRVLQEGEFERVGASESRKVDVRVVAATHHDLDAAVKAGRFRADLYYRLNVFPIALPPLRERVEDIPRLVWFFINQRQRALNRRFTSIPPRILTALQQHSWPGNVRELQNVVERAMIHSTGTALMLDDGPGIPILGSDRDDGSLESVERRHIEDVLRRCRWRINGAGNAAEVLGLHPNTLRFRMKKLGVRRPAEPGLVVDVGRLSA